MSNIPETGIKTKSPVNQIVDLVFNPNATADYVVNAIENMVNQENDLQEIFNNVKSKVQNLQSEPELNQVQRDIVNALIKTAMYALCMVYPVAVSIDHRNPAYFVLALVFLIVMEAVAKKVKKNDDSIQEQKLKDIYKALLEMYPELIKAPSVDDDFSALTNLEL